MRGDGFSCTFERGRLTSYLLGAREQLASPLEPCFCRPQTDNDRGLANFVPALLPLTRGQIWKRASLGLKASRIACARGENAVDISVLWKHPLCSSVETLYRVFGDGSIEIAHEAASKRLPMIRCGVRLALAEGVERAEWFGRGPQENYPDRGSGAFLSRYGLGIGALSHSYMRPQENGARCGVRRFSLIGDAQRLRVEDMSGDGLVFSARRCSDEALERAAHIHEVPFARETTVHIDGAMCGVGGDLPGMSALHEAYILKPKTVHRARFRIRFR